MEERIRKAREKGAFDNLEGHGKPLNLYENPFEPPDMRMAFKLLKDAGFCPYWMELGKEVDASIERFWLEVERFQKYLKVKQGKTRNTKLNVLLDKKVAQFYRQAREQLNEINRKIDNFNCQCPLWWLSRGRLNVNEEMEKVKAMIDKTVKELNAL